VSLYASLGVRRVVNACGIYTDLGGSRLSGAAWAAAEEANAVWASMDDLLARSGERIASLVGCEAARVVPGAAAGIVLSLAALIARGDGPAMEALPAGDARVVLQPAHAYKYARLASLAGARVVPWFEDGVAAALHPAHLDAAGEPLAAVAPLARARGAGVVVDAAYLSFPLSELARWTADADLACFSAKYFWGPNGGGFVAGRREAVEWLAALDFTGYESGPWLTFGRAWKLDRATVCATVAALEEWTLTDHAARWEGYAALARSLAARCAELPGAECALRQFTLDERLVDGPVNAVVVSGCPDPAGVVARLAAGDPSVRAMLDGDALVLCTEALSPIEVDEVAAALYSAWPGRRSR
jgi:D-glucosaminate-6-phosphate ammonia-lyase